MDKKSLLRRAMLATMLFAGVAIAATTGSVHRQTTLRTKPYSDAPARTVLASGAKVTILERKGGWMLVKSGIRAGWVRMLDVRTGEVAGPASVSVIGKGTVQLATGRTGTGNVVATSGVRGLDEESLGKAEPDAGQLSGLKGFTASESAARAYARGVGLKSRTVAALPVPGAQP